MSDSKLSAISCTRGTAATRASSSGIRIARRFLGLSLGLRGCDIAIACRTIEVQNPSSTSEGVQSSKHGCLPTLVRETVCCFGKAKQQYTAARRASAVKAKNKKVRLSTDLGFGVSEVPS